MSSTVSVEGCEAAIAKVRALTARVPTEAQTMLRAWGNMTLLLSSRQVPVKTGRLKKSRRVEDAGPSMIALSYNTPYAAAVHERLNAHHPVGKAKYLEDPVKSQIRGLANALAGIFR